LHHPKSLARLAAGAAILSFVSWSWVGGDAAAAPITLEQALQRASGRPLVGMASASAQAARHDATQASLPADHPEVSVGAGPRFTGDERTTTFQVGLGQTIQLGGKRDARRAVAEASVEAADAEQRAASLAARAQSWRAFQLALLQRERVAMAREAEQVSIQVDEATRERQKVGFGKQLEVNLTTAEVGRARHERLDAERTYDAAVAALASAIGAQANESFEPTGTLEPTPALVAAPEALIARALRDRPEARRARASSKVARAEIRAADAEAIPDLTLGASYGYERDPDLTSQTLLATVSIGVPLWNRNQGKRRAVRARADRSALEVQWTTTEIEREIRVALAGYQRAREAVLGFDKEVNERLHENLELARASYTSGKIDYFQFNVVRRELLASRNAYLDAFEETIEAWSAVQQATGGEVMP
jgi:cobalt-zinc-cadmium efflux system outer membrane protein